MIGLCALDGGTCLPLWGMVLSCLSLGWGGVILSSLRNRYGRK